MSGGKDDYDDYDPLFDEIVGAMEAAITMSAAPVSHPQSVGRGGTAAVAEVEGKGRDGGGDGGLLSHAAASGLSLSRSAGQSLADYAAEVYGIPALTVEM